MVVRDSDADSRRAVASLISADLPFRVRMGIVSEPGFMPPVREGLRLAIGDIVAVMDDDAEALPGWCRGLLRHYADSRVGAVGGRYVNVHCGKPVDVPTTSRVGYVTPFGQFVGDMYKRPTFSGPVEVQFLMGGCMSYRSSVARSLEFDPALNNNVAFSYEVDLGLQVRAGGWIVLFDPAVVVHHYSAPRAESGMRVESDRESVYWYAHNHLRIAMSRFPLRRRVIALLWQVLVGERRAPGLLPWLLAPLSMAMGFHVRVAGAALKGRCRAVAGTVARPARVLRRDRR